MTEHTNMKPRLAPSVTLLSLLAVSALGAVESGPYQVAPGATMQERGDAVTNNNRIVPLSATVRFDLGAVPPSVTAFMSNAVLEGGDPFPLTVRSSYAYPPSNGTYRFSGDYLGDINPSGTQYHFDWRFSPSTNGRLVWNGYIAWVGGHFWDITISNITLVPQPWLTITRAASNSVQLAWSTNFPGHGLEYATSLPTVAWSGVTNAVSSVSNRLSVTLEINGPNRFYRLRKP